METVLAIDMLLGEGQSSHNATLGGTRDPNLFQDVVVDRTSGHLVRRHFFDVLEFVRHCLDQCPSGSKSFYLELLYVSQFSC